MAKKRAKGGGKAYAANAEEHPAEREATGNEQEQNQEELSEAETHYSDPDTYENQLKSLEHVWSNHFATAEVGEEDVLEWVDKSQDVLDDGLEDFGDVPDTPSETQYESYPEDEIEGSPLNPHGY